jgi:hypothetical protein
MFRLTKFPQRLKDFDLPLLDSTSDPGSILSAASHALEKERSDPSSISSKKVQKRINALEEVVNWAQGYAHIRAQGLDHSVFGITEKDDIKTLSSRKSLLDIAYLARTLYDATVTEIEQGSIKPITGSTGERPLIEIANELQLLLKKRNSSFADDIGNIVYLVSGGAGSGTLRDLTISETDDPKSLVESGKYPTGATSCQNYDGDVGNNKCLLATIVDADKKLLEVKKPDGTIMARAIYKIVWISPDTPALFIEPTYTPLKPNLEFFNQQFDQWACKKAAAMGGMPVFRGLLQGKTRVTVRSSRNNGIQYEDGGTGSENNAGLGIQYGTYTMGATEVL